MRYYVLVIYIIVYSNLYGQILNESKSEEIGTVEFFREDNALSFPAAALRSGDLLELRFDIFTVERAVLDYKIELCDYNWNLVDEETYNYLEGYGDNTLDPYSTSINTTVDYMHYRLLLPNEDIDFIKPGNYLITVYRNDEIDNPLLRKKFVIFEDLTSVDVTWDKIQSQYLQTSQELHVAIAPIEISTTELSGNIKLLMIQNNNWKTAQFHEKYTASSGNIEFNLPGQIVFNGLNEFRFFDMKSFRFISERVKNIEYKAPNYHVNLKPDKLAGDKEYFTKEDLNGLFYIDNTDTDAEDITDADYAWVHFTLKTDVPLPADIFIEGAITDWEFQDNYMEFNPEKGTYEKKLLLKQGLYNYRYVMRDYSSKANEYYITEGEHYITCNNYLVILYYQKMGELYFSPIGIAAYTTKQ